MAAHQSWLSGYFPNSWVFGLFVIDGALAITVVGLLWTAVSPVVGFGFAAIFIAAGTVALAKSRTS